MALTEDLGERCVETGGTDDTNGDQTVNKIR